MTSGSVFIVWAIAAAGSIDLSKLSAPPPPTAPQPTPGGSPAAASAPSEFALWWNALGSGHVVEGIASVCASAQAASTTDCSKLDAALALEKEGNAEDLERTWCACFVSRPDAPASRFDLLEILRSPGLSMAFFLHQPQRLTGPLRTWVRLEHVVVQHLQKAAEAKVNTLSAEERDAIAIRAASEKDLQRAALEGRFNSSAAGLASMAGVLPGVDVDAILNKVFAGLEKAIEARAEQEATAYVLEQIQRDLCGPKSTLKTWLRATCSAASAGAFGGGPSSGGLSALLLFKKALDADLRALPGRLVRAMLEREPLLGASVAGPAGDLVDELLAGTHPAEAVERFGQALSVNEIGKKDNGGDEAAKASARLELSRLKCIATAPAGFERAASSVEDASTGVSPPLRSQERTYAALVLGLFTSTCFDGIAEDALPSEVLKQRKVLLVAARSVTPVYEKTLASQRDPPPQAAASIQSKVTKFAANLQLVLDLSVAVLSAERAGNNEKPGTLESALDDARHLDSLLTASLAHDTSAVFEELMLHTRGSDGCPQRPCFDVPPALLKSGGLIVSVADAKDAEGVKTAVLAAASPAGTWRTKYEHTAAPVLTLGGVLGFGGRLPFTKDGAGVTQPRVLVPFGLDLSLFQWQYFNLGAFVQLLDLAGYSSYVGQAGGAIRPWQCLSPGLSVRIGIAGSPLWLMAGAGYDVDTGGAIPKGAGWFAFGVGIDATLFLLHRS